MTQSHQRWHFGKFFRDNLRSELVSDVISGVAVEWVGMNVPIKFGDSRSNRLQDIRATHFVMNDDERRLNESLRRLS